MRTGVPITAATHSSRECSGFRAAHGAILFFATWCVVGLLAAQPTSLPTTTHASQVAVPDTAPQRSVTTTTTQQERQEPSDMTATTPSTDTAPPSPKPETPRQETPLDPRLEYVLKSAETSVTFANSILQWTEVVISVIGLVIVIAGVIGFRTMSNLRSIASRTAQLRDEYEERLKAIDGLRAKYDEQLASQSAKYDKQLASLSATFNRESQRFVEAAYNFGAASDAYKRGEHRRAIEYFNRALALQPTNVSILCRIGRSYTNLGEEVTAREFFQRALNIEKDCAPAYRGLAMSYRYADRDTAIEYATKALALQPDDFETHDYLGLLLRDEGRVEEAIESHKIALRIHARAETHFFLSLLYAHAGKSTHAELEILMAVAGIEEEEGRDRLRPLWASLIRLGQSMFRDKRVNEALLNIVVDNLHETREARATASHLQFLADVLNLTDADRSPLARVFERAGLVTPPAAATPEIAEPSTAGRESDPEIPKPRKRSRRSQPTDRTD